MRGEILVKPEKIPSLLTPVNLRSLYMSGSVTPSEVVEAIIASADEHMDKNIWIIAPDLKWIQPYLDELVLMDLKSTPLWGIPFAIKDNIDLAGVATTAACPDYAYVPTESATVVKRLLQAGAIPVGKTNLDQFATGLVGVRSPYGETSNSLQPELISGGSSSGSAVAVALGLAAFSLGTDTAGSGRVPAALNGLVGYKPRLGAWPTNGVVPACASIDYVTVFTHSVEDAQQVDRLVRGFDENDPWSLRGKLGVACGTGSTFGSAVSSRPRKLVLPNGPLTFYGPYAAEYEAAWYRAIRQLNRMDVPIEYVNIEMFTQAAELLYQGPWVAERWASLGAYVEMHSNSVLGVTEQV